MASSSNTQKKMEEGLKLLTFWSSSFGLRAELALKAKGIEFQAVQEDLSNKSELLLNTNPVYKKVPVLIHNGRAICESRIILEYIDETWPTAPRLLPDDPYDRYLVRFWSDFIEKRSKELRDEISTLFNNQEELIKKVRKSFGEMGMILERGVEELESKGCLYDGRNLKYMDVFFAPSVALSASSQMLLLGAGDSGDKTPCLNKWTQDLLTNDVVKSTLPDPSELMEYTKKKLASLSV